MKTVIFFPVNLQTKNCEKWVPFLVSYNPVLNSLNKIIWDNMHLLDMNEDVSSENFLTETYGLTSECSEPEFGSSKVIFIAKINRFLEMW